MNPLKSRAMKWASLGEHGQHLYWFDIKYKIILMWAQYFFKIILIYFFLNFDEKLHLQGTSTTNKKLLVGRLDLILDLEWNVSEKLSYLTEARLIQ